MHLNEMARQLQITTQQLKRELEKTNFGINPNAHEIDDALSAGVIRFLKPRVKPTKKKRRVAIIMKDGSVTQEEESVEVIPEPAKEEVVDQESEIEATEEVKDVEEKPQKPQKPKKPQTEGEKILNNRPKRALTKKEREAMEKAKRDADAKERREALGLDGKIDRSLIPKNTTASSRRNSKPGIHVNRRIEIDKDPKKGVSTDNLPKNYYKTKKKKNRKGRGNEQDDALEIIRRHPGRKVKVSRVSYEEEDLDGMSPEEIAVMKEQDREHFRAQKKHRASSQKQGHKEQPQIKAKSGIIEIPAILSLKEFSEKTGLGITAVITTLLKNGVMATINQQLDYDTAEIVATELGVTLKKVEDVASSEDLFEGDLKKLLSDDKVNLEKRPPIISIMGHVDHGKTKLLDYIRSANVVAGESGGITQHIGAYQVEKNGELITFLDTPGHEAFTSMRARGAKATDIAILVVAADEGVKPQTIEAINHAKEAGIPIIVAINKMDKPDANPDKVKGELVEHGLQAEDWGGKDIMVPVSAHTGEGIDTLLEMILLVAELEDLKANPNRMAVGTIVEAHLDKSLGPVATILVNTGTLKVGDSIVVGTHVGKIKVMHDHKGVIQKDVPPSAAVRISGLSSVPHAGDILQSFKEEKVAKERAQQLKEMMRLREESMSGSMVDRLVSGISSGEIKFLKMVLKADTKGSLEAIMQALQKIKGTDVAVKVIHFGVGNFADTDVIMAAASQALLVGFHVDSSAHVKKLAEKEHVDIKDYVIIYKLIEDTKAILSGMLEPEIRVIELGKVEIKEIFLNKKKWVIAGGKVIEGKVQSGAMVRAMRGQETLFETELDSLKHVKEDVAELQKGSDCGFKIKTPKPLLPGDRLEVFKVEKIERTLDS